MHLTAGKLARSVCALTLTIQFFEPLMGKTLCLFMQTQSAEFRRSVRPHLKFVHFRLHFSPSLVCWDPGTTWAVPLVSCIICSCFLIIYRSVNTSYMCELVHEQIMKSLVHFSVFPTLTNQDDCCREKASIIFMGISSLFQGFLLL